MSHIEILKSRQIKAARALLDWSQEDLAHHSNLSINTIRKLELGHISPRGKTMHSIRYAFENFGLEFLDPGGVRYRPKEITIYDGQDGVMDFFDDLYGVAKKTGSDIVIVSSSPNFRLWKALDKNMDQHRQRMEALNNGATVRCIIKEKSDYLPAPSYCEYRYISKSFIDSVPFYIYGDKSAIFVYDAEPFPKITVIQSSMVANTFRQQFESMWEKGTPLNTVERVKAPAKKARTRY